MVTWNDGSQAGQVQWLRSSLHRRAALQRVPRADVHLLWDAAQAEAQGCPKEGDSDRGHPGRDPGRGRKEDEVHASGRGGKEG